MIFLRRPARSLRDLPGDVSGQAVTEWALLTATVIISLAMLIPVALVMVVNYFYRIAELIALPFP